MKTNKRVHRMLCRRACVVAQLAGVSFFFGAAAGLHADAPLSFFLNADTPATGSNLNTSPLLTPFGTVTFSGHIRDAGTDPEFIAAGASGDVFDIPSTGPARLMFSFDVSAITFIYGGNIGVFNAQLLDANGSVISTFFQADTYNGQPAGPITMSGLAIRQLVWSDPGHSFAAIDNVRVDFIPEPQSLAVLFSMALISLLNIRRRSK